MKGKSIKKKKAKKQNLNEFNVINPNAAGIDISSKDNVVSVPEDRAKKTYQDFWRLYLRPA